MFVLRKQAATAAALWLSMAATTQAFAQEEERYARRLFERVAGVPLLQSDPRFQTMLGHVREGRLEEAARVAVEDESFYAVTLRNLSAPMSSREENPMTRFNDFQATFIGSVRDNLDARLLLTGDFRYEGFDDLGLPVASIASNAHYEQFEASGFGYKRNLQRVEPQYLSLPEAAGLLTTRTWGDQHLKAGTNRRAVEFTFKQFLCKDMPQIRDRGMPETRIRRDVDRAPGGDAATFHNECRTCHGILDGLGGAFARFDFVGTALVHEGPFHVVAKMNQNGTVYPQGYRVVDDSWVNYATSNHNVELGFRDHSLRGFGVKSFGDMMAKSEAFSACMVTRVYRELCRTDLTDEGVKDKLVSEFEADDYRLKNLFLRVATEESCLTHPVL